MKRNELVLEGRLEYGVYGTPKVSGVDLYGLFGELRKREGRLRLKLTVEEEDEDEPAERRTV
ncbi:MAG: hypothetical protein IIV90_06920 [Oscillospiraceae bacterium]|nr:hypothetical protein [Oscillospiraceae bacterium]